MIEPFITEENVDAELCMEFVETKLLPNVMPFDGRNPNSVIILDNASIHHVDEVIELMQSTGALVIFLPPYSPDFNPIEAAFGKIKINLKANDLLVQIASEEEVIYLVQQAFSSVTAEDCCNWMALLKFDSLVPRPSSMHGRVQGSLR